MTIIFIFWMLVTLMLRILYFYSPSIISHVVILIYLCSFLISITSTELSFFSLAFSSIPVICGLILSIRFLSAPAFVSGTLTLCRYETFAMIKLPSSQSTASMPCSSPSLHQVPPSDSSDLSQ